MRLTGLYVGDVGQKPSHLDRVEHVRAINKRAKARAGRCVSPSFQRWRTAVAVCHQGISSIQVRRRVVEDEFTE